MKAVITMNKVAAVIAVVAGVILSGKSTVWGACLGGHDPMAGYPFPDLKGALLFLIGVSVIPLGVVAFIAVVRRFISPDNILTRISIPIAILVLGPLCSLVVGLSLQALYNVAKAQKKEFYVGEKEAYSRYAVQVTSDPGIVLRERWYEDVSGNLLNGAAVSARRMVFEHSFNTDHLAVPYTGEQLREISERAKDKGLYVVCHPSCPPDLISSLWPLVMSSGQAWMIGQMIDNPSTPRHLFEEYQSERLNSNRAVVGWVDKAVEDRLKKSDRVPGSD
jgi:hypothetical protein